MPTLDSNEEQPSFTLDQVTAFLCGEKMLDGLWFGEVEPGRPQFWWRKHLRAAVQQSLADRQAAIRGARIDAVQLYMDTCEHNGVPPSWRNLREFQAGQQQALNDLNQPTKEETNALTD